MNEPIHVVGLSGGKDSTAMALRLMAAEEDGAFVGVGATPYNLECLAIVQASETKPTEPDSVSLEEMKKAVLRAYPDADVRQAFVGAEWYQVWSNIHRKTLGAGKRITEAWADAHAKLTITAKPVFVSQEHRESLAAKGIEIEGFPAKLPEPEQASVNLEEMCLCGKK